MAYGLEGSAQSLAVARRQASDLHCVGGRDALTHVLDLLTENQLEEYLVRLYKRIEIILVPAERLDAHQSSGRRALDHVMADGHCPHRRHQPKQPAPLHVHPAPLSAEA